MKMQNFNQRWALAFLFTAGHSNPIFSIMLCINAIFIFPRRVFDLGQIVLKGPALKSIILLNFNLINPFLPTGQFFCPQINYFN